VRTVLPGLTAASPLVPPLSPLNFFCPPFAASPEIPNSLWEHEKNPAECLWMETPNGPKENPVDQLAAPLKFLDERIIGAIWPVCFRAAKPRWLGHAENHGWVR